MRRNLIISALLAALVAVVQVLSGAQAGVVVLSTVIAFLIAMGVLAISDRYSRKG